MIGGVIGLFSLDYCIDIDNVLDFEFVLGIFFFRNIISRISGLISGILPAITASR
jgi:hypothetical protein